MDKKYIDLEAAVETLKRKSLMMFNTRYKGYTDAIKDLADMPAADVQEVRHGNWVMEHIGYGVTRYKCSVCGGRFGEDMIEDFRHNRFCSDCGARMDGKDGENNG